MKVQQTKIDQIISLHSELETLLNKSLDNMIRIGEMLAEIKAELPHGQFTGWIEDNLPFTPRTARNYMRIHNRRAELGDAQSITDAYKILEEPKTESVSVLTKSEENELEAMEAIMEELKPKVMPLLDELEDNILHLENAMISEGITSILPMNGQKVCLYATRTLDPFIDKEDQPFASMEITRVNEDYIDVRIKRMYGEYGYEIYNKRGGVKIPTLDILVLLYMKHFSFRDIVGVSVAKTAA